MFEYANLRDIGFHNDEIAIGGKFRAGYVQFGNVVHEDISEAENTFILCLTAKSGAYKWHLFEEGPASKSTRHVYWDVEGYIHLYLWIAGEEEIFGTYLSSLMGARSGFVARLQLDSTTLVATDVHKSKLAVFPNPIENGATVYLSVDDIMSAGSMSYTICDISGRHITAGKSMVRNGSLAIELPTLIPGIYILSMNDGTRIRSVRLSID
jgi:hypothetical protein